MPDKSQRLRPDDKLRRAIEYRAFETRASKEAPGFSGYASTWWHVDSFGTAFAPGAFLKSLNDRRDKILVLWQHDPYLPIGAPDDITEDDTGLSVNARITEATTYGRDVMALLRDDIPLGLSVGFKTIRERPAIETDPLILDSAPEWIRRDPTVSFVIEEAKLYEFSVVSFPANEFADIHAVRADAQCEALTTVLADLRAGRLNPSHRVFIDELVAARQAAPDGVRPAPRADSEAPRVIRDLFAELTVIAGTYGVPLELAYEQVSRTA